MTIGLVIAIERELRAFLAEGGETETVTVGARSAYHTKVGAHEFMQSSRDGAKSMPRARRSS